MDKTLIYIIVAAPAPDRAATMTRTTSSTTFHQLIFFISLYFLLFHARS